MRAIPRQVTTKTILWVLLAGFGLVILLLVSAGFVGITNIRSIQRSAATLVEGQQESEDLVEEIQREQEALSAVFYRLAHGPQQVDRAKVLAELDAADRNIAEIVDQTEGTEQQSLGRELKRSAEDFTAEARRLLTLENSPTLLSRDLFQRHRQVTDSVAKLLASGRQESQAAQRMITVQSRRLFTQSLLLLGAFALPAVFLSAMTVRMTTALFRRMEWQAGELSRVSWQMLDNQESIARRFSHELHDELGQSLTALRANLEALRRSGGADGKLRDCVELVEGAIANVRELSQLLRPTILDDFGLEASLRWLAESFTDRTGIRVDFHSNFPGRLADEAETHLFRIAQEALTNVARHSSARRVQVTLHTDRSAVRLSIADDGVGLAAGEAAIERGMGMVGMRARARNLGGELTVRSKPGSGVSIEVRLPPQGIPHAQEDPNTAG
ncbi:MAG: ATP-binding protein [Bryobacteraceae bacterium]